MAESEALGVDSPFQADARTMIALILTVLIGAVATAAGVGGGAIYIPLFNALVGFSLKPSTALSQACITAGSLAALAANFPRTSPFSRDEPLVDFPLMVMLTPVLLVGVGIGVLLNVMLPSWLLNILLLLLLLLLLVQAVAKGRGLWMAETKQRQEKAAAAALDEAGSRRELLPRDAPASHIAPAAALTSASLRQRQARGLPYKTEGPRALDPEEDTSLGCLEGMDEPYTIAAVMNASVATPLGVLPPAAAAARPSRSQGVAAAAATLGGVGSVSRRRLRRGGGGSSRSYADASWDCMEGVSAGSVIHEYGEPLVPEGEPGDSGTPHGGEGSLGAGGEPWDGGAESPSGHRSRLNSQLHPAPSWRAFNELGVADFDTSGNEATDTETNTGRRGPFPAGTRSPFSLPPFPRAGGANSPGAGRLFAPNLHRRPSAGARDRLPLGRRSSYDPATLAALAAGAAGAASGEGESWLQRRSKWRSRFPPAALPHRVQQPLAPTSPAARPSFSAAAVPPSPSVSQQQRPPSASRSGSMGWLQSRTSRPASGPGGGVDRDGVDQPLLGPEIHDMDLDPDSPPPATVNPDPRVGYGLALPPMPAAALVPQGSLGFSADGTAAVDDRVLVDTPTAGGAAGGVLDSYRRAQQLETLLEEGDDGAAVQPGAAAAAAEARAAATASPRSVFAAAIPGDLSAAVGTPDGTDPDQSRTPQKPAGLRSTAPDATAVVRSHFEVEEGHSLDGDGGMHGEEEQHVYDGPYNWQEWFHDAAEVVAARAKAFGARWAAAFRRVPRSYAMVLIGAWAIYLTLQGVKAFQPQCSPAWWALFMLQIAAMGAISLGAVWMAGRVLREEREAAAFAAAAAAAAEEGRAAVAASAPLAAGALGPIPAGGTYQPPVLPPSGERGDEGSEAQDRRSGRGAAGVSAAAAAVGPVAPAAAGVAGQVALNASQMVVGAPLKTLTATFAAGLTGGLLGLGGGMVMGPLLLQIGVHPQITAATSGAMVLFSSSSALAQFALLHRLNTQYALIFGLGSLAAGLVGTNAVARAVKRSGRPSIVVLALAGVMAAGTLCVAVFGMRSAAKALADGDLGFRGLCATKG